MAIETIVLASALGASAYVAPDNASITADVTPPRAVIIDLPLSLDDVLLGEIVTQIRGEEVAVRTEDLVSLIDGQVDPATIGSVRSAPVNADGFTATADLAEAGLTLVYTPETLSLKVVLSTEQRGVQEISLRRPYEIDPVSAIQPANFSAGLTSIVRTALIHEQPGAPSEFEPVRADLFGFASIGGFDGWTLHWEADLDAGRDSLIKRRDVALVKDNFEQATRLTIGDIRTRPPSNFQRSVDILGVSFRRAYEDIQPFRTLLPRGRSSFTLDRRAQVLVEVDGFVVFDQILPPGAYDLSNFPLTNGSNNAVITVDDGAGPREVGFFSAFIDSDLLGEGLSRFDLNAGVLSNGFAAAQRYSDEPAIAASYDRGVSTDLTLGTHIEASFDLAQVSGSVAIGTPIGIVSGQITSSRSSDGWGAGAVVQYRTQFETGPLRHRVAAQGSWRNANVQSLAGPETKELAFDLRWLVQTPSFQVNADASYRKTDRSRRTSFGVGATWRALGASWNARGQVVKRNGRSDDYRALFSVSFPLGRGSRGRARFGSDGDARLEYQRFGSFSVGESQIRTDLSRSREGRYSGSAQLRHIANRAEFDFNHQTRETQGGLFSRSELATSFGIGYADGAVQFGRPFDAGFVIVNRHETIRDKRSSLNEGGLGEAAHSDIFGPPLIPLRAGYSSYGYAVDVDDLEPGYDLGLSRIEVVPPFRAGYRVDIGSEILATVLMRLILPNGNQVSLGTGRIFDENSGDEVARFFTNRTGRLVAENLAPGSYRVQLDGRDDLYTKFVVSKDDTGIVQRGEVTMEVVR